MEEIMKQIMKHMAFWIGILCAGLAMVSCDEFPPIRYDNPDPYYVYTDADFPGVEFGTIAELKAMYSGKPVTVDTDYWIKAQVISSDQSGNLYRTMYIQDGTEGMELKMGTRNLYNDYKLGQWVYVNCNGLTLGNYAGMVGLGYRSNDPEYETSYIDNQYIIDTHIFRGEMAGQVAPKVIDEAGLKDKSNYGRYVTVKNIKYKNQIFVMLYYDPDGDRKDYANNCLFLDENPDYGNYGIDTWAISEKAFQALLDDPEFDFNGKVTAAEKAKFVAPSAYTVSQYFTMGSTDVQIRTSGYARFADTRMPDAILEGNPVNVTGILTLYQKKEGDEPNYQFTLIDLNGVEVAE